MAEMDKLKKHAKQLADDLEKVAQHEGYTSSVEDAILRVVKVLVDETKASQGGDPIVSAIEIPENARYGVLIPLLRQLEQAIPRTPTKVHGF